MTKTKKNKVVLLFVIFNFMILTGCASIIGKGSPQVISINSNPSDASLRITNLRNGNAVYNGRTPYTVTLERSAGYFKSAKYNVAIEKDGFQSQQILIEGSVNGWYVAGNLVFGGLIGWLIVDPLTGAMWTLNPETINADLGAKTSLLKNNKGLMVVLKSDIPDNLKNKMIPINIKQ